MPKYFKSKAEQLHREAFARFTKIEAICAKSVKGGIIPDRLCRIYLMAQKRCARRWYAMFK